MKKFLIAIICIAAVTSNAYSQRQPPVLTIKQIKKLPLEVTDYLYLAVPFQLAEMKTFAGLYNSDGKLVNSMQITGNFIYMYTGDLPPGAYELRIIWPGGFAVIPVVKNWIR